MAYEPVLEDGERVRLFVEEKMTIKEICAIDDMSETFVYKKLVEAGVYQPKRKPRKPKQAGTSR